MPVNSDCPSAEVLALFAQGKLPDPRAWIIAAHLDTCPPCSQAITALPPDTFQGKVAAAKPGGSSVPPNWPPAAASVSGQASRDDTAPAGVPPELANHPKFHVLRELGKGGMGVIYLAEHRLLAKPVALKVISPALLDNQDALARFHAEAKAAARLDHPNIARAHDADQAGGLHFLVMEYVEGQNLAQIVERRGPLPVVNACSYAAQAAKGLQHAFEQGMVHRDIKPHNLMLTREGKVKVLDFGLARLRSERQATAPRLTKLEAFMGTPEYMAPEQAEDARQADVRADIYSLGCTLYHLLAGRPPFVEDTPVKLVLAHFEKEARPLHELRPDVPEELSAVVAKMLAKDPAQRYQQPSEVAQALLPFIKTGPGPKAASGAPAPSWTTPPRIRNASEFRGLREAVGVRAPADVAPVEEPAADPFEGMEDEGAPPEEPEAAANVRYGRRARLIGVAAVVLALGLVAVPLALVIFFIRPVSPSTPPITPTTKHETPSSASTTARSTPNTKPERPKDGTIRLRVNVPNFEVVVDDEKAPVTWYEKGMLGEVSVPPGRRRVQVRKEGFKPSDPQIVEVGAGDTKVREFNLVPEGPPQAPGKGGRKPPNRNTNRELRPGFPFRLPAGEPKDRDKRNPALPGQGDSSRAFEPGMIKPPPPEFDCNDLNKTIAWAEQEVAKVANEANGLRRGNNLDEIRKRVFRLRNQDVRWRLTVKSVDETGLVTLSGGGSRSKVTVLGPDGAFAPPTLKTGATIHERDTFKLNTGQVVRIKAHLIWVHVEPARMYLVLQDVTLDTNRP